MNNDFQFIMPANLSKSSDGEWVVAGLASTADTDLQGEIIDQNGMDLSPIDQGKGWFNWDHKPGVENLLGTLDGYKKTNQGLFVKGRLFKNKEKSKSVYEVMSSLGKSDSGRVGMSVEGKILERDPKNPKIIKKCRIDKVALTLNPVNTKTYADLVKSLNVENDDLIKSLSDSEIEFNLDEDNYENDSSEATFTADQVVQMVQKALAMSGGYTQAPNTLSNGDAMATSDMTKKKKKKEDSEEDSGDTEKENKVMKKMTKSLYKAEMKRMMDTLQELYPDYSRNIIWEAVKNRIETKFPDINKTYPEN